VVEFRRQNQNIFQKAHFRKFSENIFVWAYQVAIRDLKKAIIQLSLIAISTLGLIMYSKFCTYVVCKSHFFLQAQYVLSFCFKQFMALLHTAKENFIMSNKLGHSMDNGNKLK
jgi:hypothetical protein